MGKTVCLLSALLFGLFPGCAPLAQTSPLVGTWVHNTTSGNSTRTTLVFNSSGAYTGTIVGTTDRGYECNGTISITNLMWSSTATTLTLSGTQMCSGSITCMAGGNTQILDCTNLTVQTTAVPYTITGNTLVIGDPSTSPPSYTRSN